MTGTYADLSEIEQRRLRALVEVDLVTADQLHAEDFGLVTPGGTTFSKTEYLDAIKSGEINYLRWEPEQIDVRLDSASGCIRYRSTIEGIFSGERIGPGRYWHTDYY